MLVDCHVHMDGYDPRDLEGVMAELKGAGVEAVVAMGMDLKTSAATAHLNHTYDAIWPAVGIHPWNAIDIDAPTYQSLKALASRPEVVAIGEVGLDLVRDGAPGLEVQRRCLGRFLGLAREVAKPLNLHVRGAYREMMEMLRAGPNPSGAIHGFSGDASQLRDWLDLGFYISLGRSLLGPEPSPEAEVVRSIPQGRLLLETDASPRYRPDGGRVTPAAVRQVAEKVAGLRGTTLGAISRATLENAQRLFSKA